MLVCCRPKEPIEVHHNFDCPQQNMACNEDLTEPVNHPPLELNRSHADILYCMENHQ